MSNKIKEISKRYGEHIFRLAVTHLFQTGIDNLKDIDVEASCEKIMKETPANYIMTPEFRADLMRCSVELAQEHLWDILKYIQTNIGIDGVTVHPGVIVDFKQNATCNHIMTCIIPPDTEADTLDEVIDVIEKNVDDYLEKRGSCYGFSFTDAISEAFKAAGVTLSDIPVDKTYYL